MDYTVFERNIKLKFEIFYISLILSKMKNRLILFFCCGESILYVITPPIISIYLH